MFYTENLYCTIKIGFRRSSPKLFYYSTKILGFPSLGVRSCALVKAISEVVLQVLDKQHQYEMASAFKKWFWLYAC